MSLIIFFSLDPSRMFQVHKYEDEGRVQIDHVICHMIVLIKKKLNNEPRPIIYDLTS